MSSWKTRSWDRSASRPKDRIKRPLRKVTCVNIPSLPSLSEDNETEPATQSVSEADVLMSTKPHTHIFDTDPARLELAKAEEAKRKRKCNETLFALEKIQGRIDYTITEYEGSHAPMDTSANLEMVEDSNQLFQLLADPKNRSKYRQKLTVFIVGYEEKREELENVLVQLQDFFVETQAGGTNELLRQVAEEELDLDEATRELGGALATAQNAAKKLVGIKKEMNKLVSIVAAYPDTSKGRKKMEKALLKAQEDVAAFTKSLDEVQATLKESTEKELQLQVQLDAKKQECSKLRKTADQVRPLQEANDEMKNNLETAENALEESQESLSEARLLLLNADKNKVRKLEAELDTEQSKSQQLVAEMELLVQSHGKEMEALKAEYEAESNEVRGRFQDQLKSLMEEDVFGEENVEDSTAEGEDAIDTASNGKETSSVEMLPETSAIEAITERSPIASTTSISGNAQENDNVDRLREEFEVKEKLAQTQMEEIKAKSRKMIALLQSEVAGVNSKRAADKEGFENEIGDLRNKLTKAESVEKELSSLKEEQAILLENSQQKDEELQQVKEKLQAKLENISSHKHSAARTSKSQMLSSLSSLQHAQSPMQSVSTVPMVALEEAPYGHPDSQMLMSSADLMGDDQFPSSLEQSLISMDPAPLGSPLQSYPLSCAGSFEGVHPGLHIAPQSTPPQCSLSMLAVSRLSHNSQSAAVHHSHPVVTEWGKAYDSIIKFQRNLVVLLSEHQSRIPQLASFIEELQSIELHSLDQKQDVQGQITEMRFSLALLLHQIEQTLQESFGHMLAAIETRDQQQVRTGNSQGNEMETAVAQLTKKLKQREASHKAEVERNKDNIFQLSNKLESMKMQVAQLRKALPSPSQANGDGVIMFTRLDSERNRRALQTALERKRISSATLSRLSSGMDNYLSIPGQRLAALSQRYHEKVEAAELIQRVHRSYPDPGHAASILSGIVTREERRQELFASTMDTLGAQRSELAHSLTDMLGCVERETKTFLIKPIFSKPCFHSQDLITPLPRPLPASRGHSAASGSVACSRPLTNVGCRPATSSVSVRMIQSFLQSQRHQADPQELIDSVNAANSPSRGFSPSPWTKNGRPLSTQHLSATPSQVLATGVWNSRDSSVHTKDSETDVLARYSHELQPSFSRMAELDISRHRQPDTLLGHMLPNLHHQHSRGYTPGSRHHTPSPQKLITLSEESSAHNGSSGSASQLSSSRGTSWKRSQAATVQVPTRADTIAVV